MNLDRNGLTLAYDRRTFLKSTVALAGLALVVAIIEVAVTLTQLVRQASAPPLPAPSPWMSAITPILQQATHPGVAWLLLALLVTLLSVTFSLRLASGRA